MAHSPTVTAIRDKIFAILDGVPDSGNVFKIRRNIKKLDKYLAAFKANIGGQDQIRGFQMEPPRTATLPKTQNLCFFKRAVWPITGYFGWHDDTSTDLTVSDFIEDNILPAFMADTTLDGTIITFDEIRTFQDTPLFFGTYLVHRPVIEIELEYQVQLT